MSLWSPPPRHSSGQDWISLSSMRPSTPEVMSSASRSGSPFSDTSSGQSGITRLSTTTGSLFAGGLEDTPSPSPSHSAHGDGETAPLEHARPPGSPQPASPAEAAAGHGNDAVPGAADEREAHDT